MSTPIQPLTWLVVAIAGWVQRDQQAAIVYLLEESRGYCQVGVIVARLVPVGCCASRFHQAHVTSCQAMKARPLSSR